MSEKSWRDDIRVVVGIDFGTTYSGFAFCHTSSKNICTNNKWPDKTIGLKTNTVLQYDPDFKNVVGWGKPVLKQPSRRNKNEARTAELFKLYLGNLQENLKPEFPVELGYERAITDYLREIGKLIKKTIEETMNPNEEKMEPNKETMKSKDLINFEENVLFVLSVPAEYSEKDKAIVRKCAHKAGLIKDRYSLKLQFTTEPEAAAIYCMENKLQEYDLLTIGTTFMIVDCGGGTVDLTTRKLVGNEPLQLGEVTERIGDFCGSTFIDKEFVKFLRKELGTRAIDLLIENHYDQYQFLIQEFCRRVKIPFTGNNSEFHYELDIEEHAPALLQYVSKEIKEIMEENDWLIDIKYNDIKNMFDPIIERIIRMIDIQLKNNKETCSAIFLVGGFSESLYLQKEIKKKFQHIVNNISVPNQPEAAVVRGTAIYGLSLQKSSDKMDNMKSVISTRVLKFTYGVKTLGTWHEGHPLYRKVYEDKIHIFLPLVERETEVKVYEEFSECFRPFFPFQSGIDFEVFKTSKNNARYCDEEGVEPVGILHIDLPDEYLGKSRSVTFGFYFGQMEITAFAKNDLNGQNFQTKFDLL